MNRLELWNRLSTLSSEQCQRSPGEHSSRSRRCACRFRVRRPSENEFKDERRHDNDRTGATDVKNLDRYGSPALLWRRVRDLLAAPSPTNRYFLGTVGPDGRPHAAGVGALWFDGDLYVVSGPGTGKSRNLEATPAGTIAAALHGIDLVFEGEATRVTDGPTLERLAELYRAQGWPAEVEGAAFTAPYSAPSAGPFARAAASAMVRGTPSRRRAHGSLDLT